MADEMDELEKDEEKKDKKEKKKKGEGIEGIDGAENEEEEKLSTKILLFFITILIIAIWLGIIGLFIKMDFGGFGSDVLYPVLKDVPYVNKILPLTDEQKAAMQATEEDTQYQYGSIAEAVRQIKELELELEAANTQIEADSKTIDELNAQVADLSGYKENQAAFEKEKEKYYEEVVFGDEAPDIEEYKTYYESIDSENAAVLYKQVVEQTAEDEKLADYISAYSSMKPKEAAAIFDTMTDNLQLVADILEGMDASSRASILGVMDSETAAKVTEIMKP